MKTTIFCLLLTAFLVSCQSEGSIDSAKENIWKRNTSGGLNANADNNNNNPATPTDAPIDGGLSVLLIAGVAYGAKRMHRQKKA